MNDVEGAESVILLEPEAVAEQPQEPDQPAQTEERKKRGRPDSWVLTLCKERKGMTKGKELTFFVCQHPVNKLVEQGKFVEIILAERSSRTFSRLGRVQRQVCCSI